MPTYEYECLDCKHEFEEFQSMKDDPLKICPKCKGEIKRKIGMGLGICVKKGWKYVSVPNAHKKSKAELGEIILDKAKKGKNFDRNQQHDYAKKHSQF